MITVNEENDMKKSSLNRFVLIFRSPLFVRIAIFIMVWSYLPAVSIAQQSLATLSNVTGVVVVNGQEQQAGMSLNSGDVLEVMAEASAVIQMSDGSMLEIGENSKIDVAELRQIDANARVSRLKLAWGWVRAQLAPGHQGEGSVLSIETPNAVIGVKFSQPDIEVSYNPSTQETIGLAHTVALLAKNLLTDEELLVPVGSTVIVVGATIKIVAGILTITGISEVDATGVTSSTTATESTGSAANPGVANATSTSYAGIGTGTKIALGVGAVAAAGGVAAITLVEEDQKETFGLDQISDFNWYLGAQGLSCNQVCAGHGGCDQAGVTYAGSQESVAVCTAVLNALGAPPDADGVTESKQVGLPTGCSVVMTTGTVPLAPAWIVFYSGDCAASFPDDLLACACQN